MSNDNIHRGHRDRLKNKFIKNGFDDFEQHEILEMFLFYAIPRRDTNPLAHKMLDKYGSIGRLCDTPIDTLIEDFDLTKNAAVLLKMLPELSRAYISSKVNAKIITRQNAVDVLRPMFIGSTGEKLVALLTDAANRLIVCEVLSKGTLSDTPLPTRKLVDLVLRRNAKFVYLAHNHPSGYPTPSTGDLKCTTVISKTLAELGVMLLDHYVFTDYGYVSFKDNKLYSRYF